MLLVPEIAGAFLLIRMEHKRLFGSIIIKQLFYGVSSHFRLVSVTVSRALRGLKNVYCVFTIFKVRMRSRAQPLTLPSPFHLAGGGGAASFKKRSRWHASW